MLHILGFTKRGNIKSNIPLIKPLSSGSPFFGDSTCFLFSITNDTKLLPVSNTTDYLWLGPHSFSFGNTDLQIEVNYKRKHFMYSIISIE